VGRDRLARESEHRGRLVAYAQGGYYLVTGVWPLLHIRSFEWVTGPKVDRWLVKVAGALISVIGSAIGVASWRRRLTPEIALLAMGSSVALATVDVVYVARRRIRWVYQLDAVVQAWLLVGWGAAAGAVFNQSDTGHANLPRLARDNESATSG
jgi:hypothetical protein